MHANILNRIFSLGAVVIMAVVLAGCGGGAGSENFDDGGADFDPINGKTIYRSLENETDMEVMVDLYINDRELVNRDPIFIRPHSYINVEISGLEMRDYIAYYAEFDDGQKTQGTFDQDGATVFRNNRSRANAVTTEHVNGKQAVKAGGQTVKLSAKKAK